MRNRLFLGVFLLWSATLNAQFRPENGVSPTKLNKIALTKVDVYVSPTQKLTNATLLVADNKVVAIGESIKIPDGYVEFDREGYTIVPAFIEVNSNAGTSKPKSEYQGNYPQLESAKKGDYYWNEAIHPEVRGVDGLNPNDERFNELKKLGFGFVTPIQNDGIVQGTAPLVAIGASNECDFVLRTELTAHFSFNKGVSQQTYPSSLMGSIALLRQSLYDLNYYKLHPDAPLGKQSMEAWVSADKLPTFFKVNDKWDILRAERLAKEFNKKCVYLTTGDEYAISEKLKEINASLVVPLNFPKPFSVNDPYTALNLTVEELKHWELAPFNFILLRNQGLSVAITAQGTPTSSVWNSLRKLISLGAKPEDVLAALTQVPASFLGLDSLLGSLNPGALASFGLYDKDPFYFESDLHEMWSLGQPETLKPFTLNTLGKYNLNLKNARYEMAVNGNPQKPSVSLIELKDVWDSKLKLYRRDTLKTSVNFSVTETNVTLQFTLKNNEKVEPYVLRGKVVGNGSVWEGDLVYPDGSWGQWSAIRKFRTSDTTAKIKILNEPPPITWYPNMAYGFDKLPTETHTVFENVTIWTNDSQGIISEGFAVVQNGLISYVGATKPNYPTNAKIVNGRGLHLTSGIIDEHSHIAISRGVNEGGQSVSAEVSIGDVVFPEDISIYRQLAGGVTAAQLLHGSANAIGGQSALIKLKWGKTPEEMKIKDAPGFIKFALGENVKQSNWGERNVIRFPQTRMGVEQVFYDAFYRAKAYQASWNAYRQQMVSEVLAPRKDLELEVIGEILDSKRFISCHSYVQSEVNMLMKVADSMGFKVNTFTHILEGYKVADKMKAHGVGGSTFADWWAYKFEVNDAIPYNAALMHQQGVTVAINSDDAEMGRRLNQEAAKTVKYGGMSEEEAWKMVTLNPAILLHLDNRMGSVSVGKDADLVLWSDNPLSILSKVKMTMIEGVVYYSEENNVELQRKNTEEKMRLILKMSVNSSTSDAKRTLFPRKKKFYHCDTLGEDGTYNENMH
jgi:imidazolonepropionase-like amidohydrolase